MRLPSILLVLTVAFCPCWLGAAEFPPPGATTAVLAGPYEDRKQAEITFGLRSYYLTPWRAYMDTWPGQRYLDHLGMTFTPKPKQVEASAALLAEAGFRQVRVEWGWGTLNWDLKAQWNRNANIAQMQSLRRHGIRPLILLNAHHGGPCPMRPVTVTLKTDVAKGGRFVILADTTKVRAGYTGFSNLTDYLAGYPLIERIDAATGRCELSAPMPKELKAGTISLAELRYRPFSGSVFKDGTPNPACAETLQGWIDYVAVVAATAKEGLGTEGAADAGFDLEVWNEYTFGSNFLNIQNYCDPKPEFAKGIEYRRNGRAASGHEAILPMTVDWTHDPANKCPGVRVINGFSSQSPWAAGNHNWPGQTGFSRHYYTGLEPLVLDPQHVDFATIGPLNALGVADGKPDGKDWHTVLPGSFFVPVHRVAMPEYWLYGYKTEFITRDIQPFPSTSGGPISFANHHRYSHNGSGRPAEVWETETNLDRATFGQKVLKEAGAKDDDPRFAVLMHAIAARGLLRQTVMLAHKGVAMATVFATNGGDGSLGTLPDAFFRLLDEDGGKLTERVRAAVGPQLLTIGRVAKLMRSGQAIDVARKLELTRLVEHDPRLVWKGDGTPANPDRFQRDDFACLPFQLADNRFAIGFYVVTQDMGKIRDASREPFDMARYAMVPQTYDLTLANLRGTGATVTAWDPLTDAAVPVPVLAATATTLTVRVSAADYPRFLDVTEAAPGPLLSGVRLVPGRAGTDLVLSGNCAGTAAVTWGPFPRRTAGLPSGDTNPDPPPTPLQLALTAGKEVRVSLAGATATDAVQITFTADGLACRWPQWPYDVRGVLGFAGADAAAVAMGGPQLPKLTGPAATAYTTGKPWSGGGPRQVVTLAGGGEATLERLSGDPALLLPVASPVDQRDVVAGLWSGVPAWLVEDRLEPVAHLGATLLARHIRCLPLGDGALLLTVRCADAAALAKAGPEIEALAAAVTISR